METKNNFFMRGMITKEQIEELKKRAAERRKMGVKPEFLKNKEEIIAKFRERMNQMKLTQNIENNEQ